MTSTILRLVGSIMWRVLETLKHTMMGQTPPSAWQSLGGSTLRCVGVFVVGVAVKVRRDARYIARDGEKKRNARKMRSGTRDRLCRQEQSEQWNRNIHF